MHYGGCTTWILKLFNVFVGILAQDGHETRRTGFARLSSAVLIALLLGCSRNKSTNWIADETANAGDLLISQHNHSTLPGDSKSSRPDFFSRGSVSATGEDFFHCTGIEKIALLLCPALSSSQRDRFWRLPEEPQTARLRYVAGETCQMLSVPVF